MERFSFGKGDKCIQIRIIPVSIHYNSIAGHYQPVRVADGPITARYRFIKNASYDHSSVYIHSS